MRPSAQTFHDYRILIVEDEYLLAGELDMTLTDLGATVIGPAGSIAAAQALVAEQTLIDCAMLDINVQGETVFPVARALAARAVPFMFTTAYDSTIIPPDLAHVVCCHKPVPIQRIIRTLGSLIAPEPAARRAQG